jgi:hypothetical protein
MALSKAMLHLLRWNLLAAAVPRLCMIAFPFAQQFYIKAAISYVGETVPRDKNTKYELIDATL